MLSLFAKEGGEGNGTQVMGNTNAFCMEILGSGYVRFTLFVATFVNVTKSMHPGVE